MKKLISLCLLVLGVLCAIPFGLAREIAPIVSTEWLANNLGNPKLVILDIRSSAQYAKGHIPGAVHAPFSLWAVTSDHLSLELPSDNTLRELLGTFGISSDSILVVVTRTETDFSRADASRVAWTCLVAGISNVSVLDGGYTKWASENRSISTDIVNVRATSYSGIINRGTLASKAYVLRKIGKSILADNRTPDEYFGITSKEGHIKSAVNLPTPWVFKSDGIFVSTEQLQLMAEGVIGGNKSKEVILYCGVGGYASTWWYLLSQVLGYQNVKLYDGSMEEWIKDPKAPVRSYSWR